MDVSYNMQGNKDCKEESETTEPKVKSPAFQLQL